MNCKFCNSEIEDNSKFCTACGKSLIETEDDIKDDNIEQPDNYIVMQETNKNRCVLCGAELSDSQAFCTKCGTAVAKPKILCSNCGTELLDGQLFCSVCGKKADTKQMIPKANKSKSRKIKLLLVGAIIFVAIIIVLAVSLLIGKGASGGNFAKMYSDIASESWCEIGSDGKWMELDTNPDNIDSDDLTTVYYLTVCTPCQEKIEEITSKLGFSTSTYRKMQTTTAMQGKQTEETDKYRVTWSYHPDKGLSVLYEIK